MITSRGFIFNKKFFQYAILVIIFSFLVLLQTSLLGHFAIYSTRLNLIFIAVFLFSFFESPTDRVEKNLGGLAMPAGAVGGFLLDIFSSLPFGTFTFTFLLLAFLIKKSNALFHKSNKIVFLISFLFSFIFYKFSFAILAMLLVLLFQGQFFFIWPIKLVAIIEFLYNFVIVGAIFLFYHLKKGKF